VQHKRAVKRVAALQWDYHSRHATAKWDAQSVKLGRDALILVFTWLLIAAMATALILLSSP
jgi:hypothetical protein